MLAQTAYALDPACQIPPADLLAAPSHRPPPYIYSAEEIAALIHAAGTIGVCVHSAFVNSILTPFVMEPLWLLWGLTFIAAAANRRRKIFAAELAA